MIDLTRGDDVRVRVSHYGLCLSVAAGAEFTQPQTWFDAGYAAAAVEFIRGLPPGALESEILACQALGAPEGIIRTKPRGTALAWTSPGVGEHTSVIAPAPNAATNVDEAGILAALATLDFAGNEEGLIPRFGVMLTRHFANFYNRISFEFVRRMEDAGLLEAAEELLIEGGLRCAFHTFGGIMTSGEWDAVVRPQCKTDLDWAHGMVACVNALGWGTWRAIEASPQRLVVRIFDDYESTGWRGMFGKASRPISYLAEGGVRGLAELVFNGGIQNKPELDKELYLRLFESPDRFQTRTTRSFAGGDPYTEIIAER